MLKWSLITAAIIAVPAFSTWVFISCLAANVGIDDEEHWD